MYGDCFGLKKQAASDISLSVALYPAFAGARPMQAVAPRPVRNVACDAASLQFIKGVAEPTVPEVRLTRSRTGANGTAIFVFENPSIFQVSQVIDVRSDEGRPRRSSRALPCVWLRNRKPSCWL